MLKQFLKTIRDEPFELNYMRYDEDLYESMLTEKISKIHETFKFEEIDVFRSPRKFFRNRCRFEVTGGDLGRSIRIPIEYGLWEGGSCSVCVESFPIACELINRAMLELRSFLITFLGHVIHDIRAAHFLSTTTKQELVVTLIYEKSIDQLCWLQEAQSLSDYLRSTLNIQKISIIAKAKKQKLMLGPGYVIEEFVLSDNRRLTYKQVEDGFSNPNGVVNRSSLEWLCDVVKKNISSLGDLLELYCGNGNHTCALSLFVRRIVAVELNKSLCEAAEENLKLNSIANVKIVHTDSQKFSDRILRTRKYTDENEVFNFSIVLVDPPRIGLDAKTLEMIGGYDDIIYISCNPEALARDLKHLLLDHQISRFAVFDHFPYTPHFECGVHLIRRNKN